MIRVPQEMTGVQAMGSMAPRRGEWADGEDADIAMERQGGRL